jgi:hypothetical protein
MNVQHWLEAPSSASSASHESVVCVACTRLHFIDRKTRKLLGDNDAGNEPA